MDPDLITRYKFCKAKVLDAKRSFILAAMAYYDLSHSPQIAEEGIIDVLNASVVCAVLAPPSQKKMLILKTLYNDERC